VLGHETGGAWPGTNKPACSCLFLRAGDIAALSPTDRAMMFNDGDPAGR
jgi:hypothetical protein